MFAKIVVTGLMLVVSDLALAGAANADISCKSASGRTIVKASVPGDFEESLIEISVDGKAQTYLDKGMLESVRDNEGDPAKLYPNYKVTDVITQKDKNAISVVAAEDMGGKYDAVYLSLSSTGALKKLPSSGIKIKFKASVTGTDPRNPQTELPEGIIVDCTYTYEI